MLNYLFRVAVFSTASKIQKNFRSLCTLVIKIHESCCSIFNELCFSLLASRLAAYLLYHFVIPLSRGFFNFFQVFLFPSCLPADFVCCSLTASLVYHIVARLSIPFWNFFRDFLSFLLGSCFYPHLRHHNWLFSLFILSLHRYILPADVIDQVLSDFSHVLVHGLFL